MFNKSIAVALAAIACFVVWDAIPDVEIDVENPWHTTAIVIGIIGAIIVVLRNRFHNKVQRWIWLLFGVSAVLLAAKG